MSLSLDQIYGEPKFQIKTDLVMNLNLFEMFYNRYLELYDASNEDEFYLERAGFFLDKKLAVEEELKCRDLNVVFDEKL